MSSALRDSGVDQELDIDFEKNGFVAYRRDALGPDAQMDHSLAMNLGDLSTMLERHLATGDALAAAFSCAGSLVLITSVSTSVGAPFVIFDSHLRSPSTALPLDAESGGTAVLLRAQSTSDVLVHFLRLYNQKLLSGEYEQKSVKVDTAGPPSDPEFTLSFLKLRPQK